MQKWQYSFKKLYLLYKTKELEQVKNSERDHREDPQDIKSLCCPRHIYEEYFNFDSVPYIMTPICGDGTMLAFVWTHIDDCAQFCASLWETSRHHLENDYKTLHPLEKMREVGVWGGRWQSENCAINKHHQRELDHW